MEPDAYVRAIRLEADRLVHAAEAAGLDAAVPSCPTWTVSDLLAHVGRVHRWAAATVERASPEPVDDRELEPAPAPAERAAWVRLGAQHLVDVLAGADPDAVVWTFTGPGPARFWARRQANETVVHRVDAQLAAGALQPVNAVLALDAIDELFWLLPLRPAVGPVTGSGEVVRIRCTEAGPTGIDDGQWLLCLDPSGLMATKDDPDRQVETDVTVEGPASDMLLVLLGRLATDSVEVRGDPAILDRFLTQATF